MSYGRRVARKGVARRDWFTELLYDDGEGDIPAVFPDLEGYQRYRLESRSRPL